MARKKDQPVALESILTTASMLELAGNRYYWRGNEYFEDGAVTSLKESGGVITGKVQGTRLYKVQIWVEDGELDHECSCPLGEDAQFCKHCVAVGLAWLAKDKPTPLAESGKKADDTIGEKDVRDFLMGKSKEDLVEMLLEQCEEDERLNRRLLAMTARTGRDKLDLSVWKDALEEAASSDDFDDWRGMHDYARGIQEVVDSVGELLREGHAEAVIEIIEHGFAVMERAMEQVDDSSGGMSMLMEQMQESPLAQVPPNPADARVKQGAD